jgi:hypothetical protein
MDRATITALQHDLIDTMEDNEELLKLLRFAADHMATYVPAWYIRNWLVQAQRFGVYARRITWHDGELVSH